MIINTMKHVLHINKIKPEHACHRNRKVKAGSYTVRAQYNDTVGSKQNMSAYRIFQYIEFHNSPFNDILIHCCLYYMYLYI